MPSVRTETTERRQFAQRLREVLQQLNITQFTLAEMVKVSPSTIGDMLNKARLPSGEVLLRLIQALDVDAHWLLTGQKTSVNKARSVEHAYRDGGRAALTEAINSLAQQRDETWSDADAAAAREAVDALPARGRRPA